MVDGRNPTLRGAFLQQSPRRRDRVPTESSVAITPTVTPTTSPERARRPLGTRPTQDVWPRRAVPAAINVAATQSTHSSRGHQFTVGNVSNGLIYLRPVIRPAHERHQDYTLPPSTPPSSAEEVEERLRERRVRSEESLRRQGRSGEQQSPPRTPTRNPAVQRSKENAPYIKSSPPVPRKRHQRSRSYTTIGDRFLANQESATYGQVQVRIDQFDGTDAIREEPRPRTAGHQENFESIDVHIPHYNLGSPRFSPNGTPFLNGSSSVNLPSTTGELGSIQDSQHNSGRWLWPGYDVRAASPTFSREITASIVSTMEAPNPLLPSPLQRVAGHAFSPASLSSAISLTSIPPIPSPPVPQTFGPLDISPRIYDHLSFPPGQDDSNVVKYHPRSQEICAATPARIITQITSAAFVDYHLLSDFFLTFRLFMNSNELASRLISRLQWAIERDDDVGKVVRVRTFVAVRHWILNYFADDFLPHLVFREEFARSINELTRFVQARGNNSDLKIIGEIKKCWRRTCALYWDGLPDAEEAGAEQDITPGGPPGSREEQFSQSRTSLLRLPQLSPAPPLGGDQGSGTDSFVRDVIQHSRKRSNSTFEKPSKSPLSAMESSTIKTKLSAAALSQKTSKSAPADPRGRRTSSHGTGPSSLKNHRPGPHKRSGSFSDALRDNRYPLPLPNSVAKSTHLFMALPYAGSLVRGNQFPPTPAFVGVIAPSTPEGELASFKFGLQATSSTLSPIPPRPSQNSVQQKQGGGPGMKRIFGSVRKAFGRHGHPPGKKTLTPTSPTTATLTTATQSRSNMSLLSAAATAANASGLKMGVLGDGQVARIDLLGAGAVEAFQRAMADNEERARTGSDAQTRSTVATSSDGTENALPRQGVMDGAVDEEQSAAASAKSDGRNTKGTDFLFSPSTSSSNGTREDDGNLHITSFLADKSEMTVSSRSSVVHHQPIERIANSPPPPAPTPPPPMSDQSDLQSVVLVGRSNSTGSSSRQNPSRLDRRYDSSIISGGKARSIRSVRSFSIRRANSFGSVMDNISEFSEFSIAPLKPQKDVGSASHTLRRRPGGNLRAAVTIGELEQPLNRPRSTGSIATTVDEFGASELRVRPFQRPFSPADRSTIASEAHPHFPAIVSLGAMGKGAGGLLPSPVIRERAPSFQVERASVTEEERKASFEAGVQMLRDLPDDASDDGGVEVALAKLEGTYQRKKSGESSPSYDFRKSMAKAMSREVITSLDMVDEDHSPRTTNAGFDGGHDEFGDEHRKRLKRRHKQVVDQFPLQTPPLLDGSTSKQGSRESLPILERGVSPSVFTKTGRTGSSAPDVVLGHGMSNRSSAPSVVDLSRVDVELEKHMHKRASAGSELSSEISFDLVQQSPEQASTFPPMAPGTIISELGIASHPLRHPPSPPLTLTQALSLSPNSKITADDDDLEATPRARKPDTSTTTATATSRFTVTPTLSTSANILQPTAIHLPFILAYDSELLAKQFTLIEKDALLEIDWKELVELSWGITNPDIKDWVKLLNTRDIKGVEMAISRFNLVCRWARSEIVMTKSADERARTIVKLIHIAAHARALANFATMYQITIALLTSDIARLKKTWSLVSPPELETFRELERLVQPTRNFWGLRQETERVTGESGCVPFVGLFTHDLILNAQRPLMVGRLVNFDRHRVTASIVKRLLRLVEASQRYTFKPVDGVAERCLWISALSDQEIESLSRGIEG